MKMTNRPDLIQILDNYMQSKIRLWTAKSNRASQIGDPCLRKLVYYRLYPELQELHDVSLQYVFNEGNIQEQALIRDLTDAGIKIVEHQRDFFDKRYNLSGFIDGKIEFEGHKWPFEIKSMSPNIWAQVNSIDDLNKYSWTAKYTAQLTCYMFLSNAEEATMVLKNKSNGQIKQLWFELDFGYAEHLLQKCEQIEKFISKKDLPERQLSEDCMAFCPFYSSCCPEGKFTQLDFIDKPELEVKIQEWELLKDYASGYNKLDKEIKSSLRGIEKAVIGDYLIEGKEIKNGWKCSIKHIGESNNGNN